MRNDHLEYPGRTIGDGREVVLETYDLDAATITMVFDPISRGAWIQSDVTEPVDP